MSIDWDGEKIQYILDNAPTVDPAVEAALKKGEYVYIDYTDIQRETTPVKTASTPALGKLLLVGGLLAVGLVLIVRR